MNHAPEPSAPHAVNPAPAQPRLPESAFTAPLLTRINLAVDDHGQLAVHTPIGWIPAHFVSGPGLKGPEGALFIRPEDAERLTAKPGQRSPDLGQELHPVISLDATPQALGQAAATILQGAVDPAALLERVASGTLRPGDLDWLRRQLNVAAPVTSPATNA